MYKRVLALSVAIVVIAVAVSAGKMAGKQSTGQHTHHFNVTCKGEILNMKEMNVGRKECEETFPSKDTSADSDEAPKENKHWNNNLCVDVCIWKKQKFINTDGTYNADQFDKLVKAVYPKSVQASFKKAGDECATANSKKFSMDNNCAGYQQFKQCKMQKFMEICEIKPKPM